MTEKTSINIILLLAVLVIGSSGGYFLGRSSTPDLSEDIISLYEEQSVLTDQLTQNTNEKKALDEELDGLEQEFIQLNIANENLNAEYDTLQNSYNILTKEHERLLTAGSTIEELWNTSTQSSVEISGIENGDISGGYDKWYIQGKSSVHQEFMRLYQMYGGSYSSQEITVEHNQGLSFMVKSGGARFEIQIDGYVVYYGDLGNDQEWQNIIVPFGDVYLGPRDLYFIILPGEDDGSFIYFDDITMVQFEE